MNETKRDDDEPPPILRTWPRVYGTVLFLLTLYIALAMAFSWRAW